MRVLDTLVTYSDTRIAKPNATIKRNISQSMNHSPFYNIIAQGKNPTDFYWWLQDSIDVNSGAYYVDNSGEIDPYGYSQTDELGVRPVIRIKI